MNASQTELIDGFTSALEAIGGSVTRAAGPRQIAAVVAAAVQGQGVKEVLYAESDLVDQLGIKLLLTAHGIDLVPVQRAGDKARHARVGLTDARVAIAETGTLLVGGRPGAWGLASVLPWIHLVLLPVDAIVADLPAGFARFASRLAGGERDWVWITGPSRTADIGKTLVLGAHGPNSLNVVIVE